MPFVNQKLVWCPRITDYTNHDGQAVQTKSENDMQVLWSKNGNYSHNDTGCPDTTGNSSHIIKGGFFVM
jgi:hypothetical protein